MLKRTTSLLLALIVLLGTFINSNAEGVKMTTTEALTMAKSIDEKNAYILTALAERESSLRPWVVNEECIGLCQINPKWWQAEMQELGIDNLFDAKQNMTLANKILNKTDYPLELKLMLYNNKRSTAFDYWEKKQITNYAMGIIKRADELSYIDFVESVNAVAVESTSNQIMVMSSGTYDMCKPLDIRVVIDNEMELYEWEVYELCQRS